MFIPVPVFLIALGGGILAALLVSFLESPFRTRRSPSYTRLCRPCTACHKRRIPTHHCSYTRWGRSQVGSLCFQCATRFDAIVVERHPIHD